MGREERRNSPRPKCPTLSSEVAGALGTLAKVVRGWVRNDWKRVSFSALAVPPYTRVGGQPGLCRNDSLFVSFRGLWSVLARHGPERMQRTVGEGAGSDLLSPTAR